MTDKEKCEQVKPQDLHFQCGDTKCVAHKSYREGWQAALRESVVCLAMYARLKELIKEDYENQMDKKAVEDYEKATS